MKDLVTVTGKTVPAVKNEKRMSLGLQSRLLYLLLKCPLLQQKRECACGRAVGSSKDSSVSQRRLHADDEEVILQVTVPYALQRRQLLGNGSRRYLQRVSGRNDGGSVFKGCLLRKRKYS